ncbi:hypothetical protein GE061_014360 [Apolygus lucorum]|uniref:Uncharacterized protein n=1 Tax=Apolygus lucorum TaxID=248454 RepID=A0A6A4K8Z0_APOLU|nr:hypothetical protein GE061_014360 [Apolygus lucorum]
MRIKTRCLVLTILIGTLIITETTEKVETTGVHSILSTLSSLISAPLSWYWNAVCLLKNLSNLETMRKFISLLETIVEPCMYQEMSWNVKYNFNESVYRTWKKSSLYKWPCLRDALDSDSFVRKLTRIERILNPCTHHKLNLNQSKEELKDNKMLGYWYSLIWWFYRTFISQQVTFHLVRKKGPAIATTIYNQQIMFHGAFDASKTTKIVIHGFKSDKNSALGKLMSLAYLQNRASLGHRRRRRRKPLILKKRKVNLVIVNWDSISKRPYYIAKRKLVAVATQVQKFIKRLALEYGVEMRDIHIIGHSLGAHVSGIAGTLVKKSSWTSKKWNIKHKRGERVGRITGLDPALPGFSAEDNGFKIRRHCAKFVDIIHTTSVTFGTSEKLGHADFYVNRGPKQQPGCGAEVPEFGVPLPIPLFGDKCSHSRAYFYYAESIVFPKAFLSRKCSSYPRFAKGLCDSNLLAYMGEDVSHKARGSYYLKTAGKNNEMDHCKQLFSWIKLCYEPSDL